jgi:hypothetical protein
MSLWSRTMAGIMAGWEAFMKDPEAQLGDLSREQRKELYAMAWAYYQGTMFSTRSGLDWESWLDERSLYKRTRLIYNKAAPVVDFYVDNLWQRAQNKEFENLVTDEKIVKAVAQLDQWGMWLSESNKIKRYAAAVGNVLVEGVDDLVRQKVYHKCTWPGFVTSIDLNETGDVQGYVLEYVLFDPEMNKQYQFRKEVDKVSTRYFRDDKPWEREGIPAVIPNEYGFVFAVWIRHMDIGSDFGLPAFPYIDKLNNTNSLASHMDDFIHKDIESPKLIGASGEITPIVGAYKDRKGIVHPQDTRLNWMVLKVDTTKGAASVNDLSGSLKLADASKELDRQLASYEDEFPELQVASIMRDQAQLSGAALERMLGPAQNRLDGVQPGYNQQLIKLRQMQISVAGWRANGGGWVGLTKQHEAFKPFNMTSYTKGDLDFTLQSAKLVHESEAEAEDLKQKKATRAETLLDVGIDTLEALQVAGYTEEQAQEILDRVQAEQDEEDEALKNAGLLPPVPGQLRQPGQPALPPGAPPPIQLGDGGRQ